MPVMILNVPRPKWNDVQMAAATHGLDIAPDRPAEEGPTRVEITGSWEKLQQTLNKAGNGVRMVGVATRRPNGAV